MNRQKSFLPAKKHINLSFSAFVRPFHFSVNFDGTEDVTGSDGDDTDNLDAPGGIVGFYLSWLQKTCS